MYVQELNPTGNVGLTIFLSLVPLITLFILLMVFRLTAWLASVIGAIVGIIDAIAVWRTPPSLALTSFLIGALTGTWAISWIVFWGLTFYNTLVLTGKYDAFKQWVLRNATEDSRIQAILLAWSFGALFEGLVGFGYPWALVSPVLIGIGFEELTALKVTAIANNAPVSYGALGTPVIILSAVTGLPLLFVSSSVAKIVAILALLPPFLLAYLVDGWRGIKDVWPFALLASISYILGQYPMASFVGPYLPDITGSMVSFLILLGFLRIWKPKNIVSKTGKVERSSVPGIGRFWLAVLAVVIVVTLWTGPWSPLTKLNLGTLELHAYSQLYHKTVAVSFAFNPAVAGTAIFMAWLVSLPILGAKPSTVKEALSRSIHQYWGGILTGVFVVGLALVFNYSGMAYSLAWKAADLSTLFIVVSPIFGWIGCALSGSNTSTNALFGAFQLAVAKVTGLPVGLTPALNSVGAEVAKPIAPQTLSAGVSTTSYVRKEGIVARNNLPWTILLLVYLILIGVLYYLLVPGLFTG
ncbi:MULTISPECIES: L-lactate permease [Metallosphaera]|uniref:L-lactate permease n=3 Tax=Metallosphaera TaxID=41980 RepID=A4YFK4_METS5|nr:MULTISPECIES: L-lactate permease [Metallosphaera]ABP95206.1 L-lactate permease [Metallosphaera sedula DSM 5348]AIM27192.1 L-lactate permease [Metallosphaera sedula]AKV74088.1 lactate permease [Metallosphaera sedula]AKV76328.1 lactate permease [Metallosphaera sedula]AKV78579.1 lactate permease [Metallosphaera sedula]